MTRNLYIFLLSLLLLVAGTFSVSAHTVDVREQSIDTMLCDSVKNKMTAWYVMEDTVNIYQTTNATDSLVNEQKEKGLWWKENFGVLVGNEENVTKIQLYIKDVMVIFISVLSVLAFIIALIMLRNNDVITKVRWIQILWLSVIVLITIYSGSQWAYIVLIALCVLEIFQYNPKLLDKLNMILRNYRGGMESSRQNEINAKIENEVKEIVRDNVSQSVSSSQGSPQSLQNEQRSTIEHYRGVESLALDYLGQKYPKLQRYVTIQTRELRRIVLDGFIEEENKNTIIEVKYWPMIRRGIYYPKSLYETMDYLTKKTKKRTELLLFIVTSTPDMKLELEKQFVGVEYVTNLEIYTEDELKNSVNN